MNSWTQASLLVNVVVLVPVSWALLRQYPWIADGFGGPTPARGILRAIYLAILLLSLVLLWQPQTAMTAALLSVQIIYKVLTPFTVGTFKNPVVVSNLLIAALHAWTLRVLVGSGALAA